MADELVEIEVEEATFLAVARIADEDNITMAHATERMVSEQIIRELEEEVETLKAVVRKRTDKIDRLKSWKRRAKKNIKSIQEDLDWAVAQYGSHP